MYVGMYVGVCMYVCMNEYPLLCLVEIMSYQEYAFILDLGGLDVNHRRCNTQTFTSCVSSMYQFLILDLSARLVWYR
jgi:hypothetical protein